MSRPPVPFPAMDGCEWRAVRESDAWTARVSPNTKAHLCRYCQAKPGVAILFRGSRRMPYLYCADHMYGRWVENGDVMTWRQVAAPLSQENGKPRT